MKSAHFKIFSQNSGDVSGLMEEAEAIFCRDPETGIGPDGYGWNEVMRVDEDHIIIGITTDDAIMDLILQDPRLELIEMVGGEQDV